MPLNIHPLNCLPLTFRRPNIQNIFLPGLVLSVLCGCGPTGKEQSPVADSATFKKENAEEFINQANKDDTIEIIIPTFLGNEKRNYYGNMAPDKLKVIWKTYLGEGKTTIGDTTITWKGAGWTGQPLMVREKNKRYLMQGSYDHHLRKIDAETGEVIWLYKFDDIIKGTASLRYDKNQADLKYRLIIYQGSRMGVDLSLWSKQAPSFRAISYFTGEEVWRHNVSKTRSYSRDVDGSGLLVNDTLYIGFENGLFTKMEAGIKNITSKDGHHFPKVFSQHKLFTKKDIYLHKGNLVTESSPALLNDRIYITAGSGHVYGYNIENDSIEWDFYIGSDLDGSPVVTEDSCILIAVEKQYIKGKGGVLKLDPSKKPENAVVWYKPVEDKETPSWQGGVIGSPGTNEQTRPEGFPRLVASSSIDGHLYVFSQNEVKTDDQGRPVTVRGFDDKTYFNTPVEVFRYYMGPSISTPIFVNNKLIVGGYNGLYLFEYDKTGAFTLLDRFGATFEATPIAIDKKLFVASRNGYLYCFGD